MNFYRITVLTSLQSQIMAPYKDTNLKQIYKPDVNSYSKSQTLVNYLLTISRKP